MEKILKYINDYLIENGNFEIKDIKISKNNSNIKITTISKNVLSLDPKLLINEQEKLYFLSSQKSYSFSYNYKGPTTQKIILESKNELINISHLTPKETISVISIVEQINNEIKIISTFNLYLIDLSEEILKNSFNIVTFKNYLNTPELKKIGDVDGFVENFYKKDGEKSIREKANTLLNNYYFVGDLKGVDHPLYINENTPYLDCCNMYEKLEYPKSDIDKGKEIFKMIEEIRNEEIVKKVLEKPENNSFKSFQELLELKLFLRILNGKEPAGLSYDLVKEIERTHRMSVLKAYKILIKILIINKLSKNGKDLFEDLAEKDLNILYCMKKNEIKNVIKNGNLKNYDNILYHHENALNLLFE